MDGWVDGVWRVARLDYGGSVFLQPAIVAGDANAASISETEAIVLLQSVRLGEELSLTGSSAQKRKQLERLCSRIEVSMREKMRKAYCAKFVFPCC